MVLFYNGYFRYGRTAEKPDPMGVPPASNFVDSSHPGTLFSGAHYAPFGLLTSSTLGNSLNESLNYDTRLRVKSYTAASGTTTPFSLNITSFAPNGDILAANDSVNGNWTYSYDDFNRLSGSNQNSGQSVYSYAYDRFGNRWQQNGQHSMQLSFSGANNRMDGYSYDAAGNLLNDGSHSYFYDAENRLTQVDGTLPYCRSNGASGTVASACYFYDANGHRVRSTGVNCYGSGISGGVGYTYDLSGRWISTFAMSTTGGGAPCQYEVFAGSRHLGQGGGAAVYSHVDWLGTERVRTQSGSVCESTSSLPFGDGQTTTGNCYNSSRLHFTGKERDSESGLDNFGARYDSSSMGRFMSPDPLGGHQEDPQTLNKYAYVRNNPTTLTDPTGLDFWLQGGNACGQNGVTCDKKGYVLDSNNNRVLIGNTQLRDANSGDTANFDTNGVHITTAQGTFTGQFAAGTPDTRVEGAGDFAGMHAVFNSDCGGTCNAGGALFGTKAQFDALLPKLLKNPGMDNVDPFHPGTDQYRGGNKEGPDAHLSFKASDDPNQRDPFHFDNRYPYGSAGGFGEHTGGVFHTIWNSIEGKQGPPLPKDIPIASVPQRPQ